MARFELATFALEERISSIELHGHSEARGLHGKHAEPQRHGSESNRRITELQTVPLPLGYHAITFHESTEPGPRPCLGRFPGPI